MKYYKIVSGNYILSILQSNSALFIQEITAEEYATIKTAVDNKPAATPDYDYRLKTDLTWERYEITPPSPEEPTIEDKAEAYDILMGVES